MIDFNAVLDEFKSQSQEWVGIAVVEARLSIRSYRWMADGRLGVSEHEGFTLRPATDREYTDLERGISAGRVSITKYNRISRQIEVILERGQ